MRIAGFLNGEREVGEKGLNPWGSPEVRREEVMRPEEGVMWSSWRPIV